jgi:ubiquinone/menaquinone biosynthesis C-methylase UbiE
MTQKDDVSHQNTYFIDVESGAELARLLLQDRLITQHLGGPLPGHIDLTGVRDTLDVACGPGGWALDLAQSHPEMRVVGIDKAPSMVEYALEQAKQLHLNNVDFVAMDALHPLQIPDNSFDLVNGRFLIGFMRRDDWPRLMRECLRVLRPGGIMRLTEADTWNIVESPAVQRFGELQARALYASGSGFTTAGPCFGLSPQLSRFLRAAGYERVQHAAFAIDISAGMPSHEGFAQNIAIAASLLLPFLLKTGTTTQDEFDHLYQQIEVEMHSSEFCGLWFFLSAWGYKPV